MRIYVPRQKPNLRKSARSAGDKKKYRVSRRLHRLTQIKICGSLLKIANFVPNNSEWLLKAESQNLISVFTAAGITEKAA